MHFIYILYYLKYFVNAIDPRIPLTFPWHFFGCGQRGSISVRCENSCRNSWLSGQMRLVLGPCASSVPSLCYCCCSSIKLLYYAWCYYARCAICCWPLGPLFAISSCSLFRLFPCENWKKIKRKKEARKSTEGTHQKNDFHICSGFQFHINFITGKNGTDMCPSLSNIYNKRRKI